MPLLTIPRRLRNQELTWAFVGEHVQPDASGRLPYTQRMNLAGQPDAPTRLHLVPKTHFMSLPCGMGTLESLVVEASRQLPGGTGELRVALSPTKNGEEEFDLVAQGAGSATLELRARAFVTLNKLNDGSCDALSLEDGSLPITLTMEITHHVHAKLQLDLPGCTPEEARAPWHMLGGEKLPHSFKLTHLGDDGEPLRAYNTYENAPEELTIYGAPSLAPRIAPPSYEPSIRYWEVPNEEASLRIDAQPIDVVPTHTLLTDLTARPAFYFPGKRYNDDTQTPSSQRAAPLVLDSGQDRLIAPKNSHLLRFLAVGLLDVRHRGKRLMCGQQPLHGITTTLTSHTPEVCEVGGYPTRAEFNHPEDLGTHYDSTLLALLQNGRCRATYEVFHEESGERLFVEELDVELEEIERLEVDFW